jgi:rhodanese-related sulfurtransferase
MQTISPQELSDLLSRGKAELIDVRTPAEYREVHIEGARNVPLDRLQPDSLMAARNGQSDQPLYLTCKSGKRGSQACQKFIDAGFDRVVNVDGGVDAWESAELPVVRGKKTISLERQVRIAAGLLVFTGVALGYWVHEAFLILSGFVGLGLVFAGITDTCGMGMLLAKMPWNQVKCTESAQQTCSR